MPSTGERFERAVSIMARLRGPGGCAWDREQTFDSIKPYTVEETYEVLEAIDNKDWSELPGELGDLLLQVLFYSQIADEEHKFSIDDVLDRLADKLINRHPHVFGNSRAETSAEVLRNWDAIKAREKGSERDRAKSLLDGIGSATPALLEAHKLGSRSAKVGFDWPSVDGLFDKLQEEIQELRHEISRGNSRVSTVRLEEELGDLFFVLVNLARHLSLDAESSLKRTNRKFRKRFQWMEKQLASSGHEPNHKTLEEWESLWQKAKQHEGLK